MVFACQMKVNGLTTCFFSSVYELTSLKTMVLQSKRAASNIQLTQFRADELNTEKALPELYEITYSCFHGGLLAKLGSPGERRSEEKQIINN